MLMLRGWRLMLRLRTVFFIWERGKGGLDIG